MNDNIISFNEGCDLLNKLFSEQTPVYALLVFGSGSRSRVNGRLNSITSESGLVISVASPPSKGAALISIPLLGRNCEFSFGDIRDLPEDSRTDLAAKFGDTLLCLRFPDESEFLVLVFSTLS